MEISKANPFSCVLENGKYVRSSVTMSYYGVATIGVKKMLFISYRKCRRNKVVP